MAFTKERVDDTLTVRISDRLDSATCEQVEQALKPALAGVKMLVFDLNGLEYLSSAGLRTIVACQKTMNRQGKMRIRNVSAQVRTVFSITGIERIVNIVD